MSFDSIGKLMAGIDVFVLVLLHLLGFWILPGALPGMAASYMPILVASALIYCSFSLFREQVAVSNTGWELLALISLMILVGWAVGMTPLSASVQLGVSVALQVLLLIVGLFYISRKSSLRDKLNQAFDPVLLLIIPTMVVIYYSVANSGATWDDPLEMRAHLHSVRLCFGKVFFVMLAYQAGLMLVVLRAFATIRDITHDPEDIGLRGWVSVLFLALLACCLAAPNPWVVFAAFIAYGVMAYVYITSRNIFAGVICPAIALSVIVGLFPPWKLDQMAIGLPWFARLLGG